MPALFTMTHTGRSANVLSDPMVSGIFTGEDAGPGGAAYLAGGIATGEFYALVGNAVDIGRFVKSGAFISKVHRTEIIHQNKQYIRLLGEEGKWGN